MIYVFISVSLKPLRNINIRAVKYTNRSKCCRIHSAVSRTLGH